MKPIYNEINQLTIDTLGSYSSFSGSNNIDSVAWNAQNSNQTTHPVGQKLPNELGIYDMTGNVSEWIHDFYLLIHPKEGIIYIMHHTSTW